MGSILADIKGYVGLSEAQDTLFDKDIIMHVNTAFSFLSQLGVGPANGFFISDVTQTWDEFTTDVKVIGFVKTYIFIKVKLMFDPPQTSFVLDALDRQLQQVEWRLSVQVEGETL